MSGFWTGGYGAYLAGLAQEHEQEARELKQQLKSAATQAERERLLQEIKELHAAYRTRQDAIGRCLF